MCKNPGELKSTISGRFVTLCPPLLFPLPDVACKFGREIESIMDHFTAGRETICLLFAAHVPEFRLAVDPPKNLQAQNLDHMLEYDFCAVLEMKFGSLTVSEFRLCAN